MARPAKNTISQFPFFVDFFDSEEMVCIAGEFGIKGEIAAVKLLCAVFKEGYFAEWSIYRRAMMIRLLPGISPDLLDQIVMRLVRWGFFDKGLFDSAGILTSVAIQRSYFNAIKRRTTVNKHSLPFLLVNPDQPNQVIVRNNDFSENEIRVIANKNGVSAYKNSENDAKTIVKEENPGVSAYNNEVFAYKNPENDYENPKSDANNVKTCKNEVFADKNRVSVSNNGVSAYNNSDSADNNPENDAKTFKDYVNRNRVSVSNNGVSAYKNSEIADNNPEIALNNPINIKKKKNIYNNSSSTSNKGGMGGITDKNGVSAYINPNSAFNISEIDDTKGKNNFINIDSAIKTLQNDEKWKEEACRLREVKSSELEFLLTKFKEYCTVEEKKHTDLKSVKSHFSRWLPYGKQIHLESPKKYEDNSRSREVQHRGTETVGIKKEDFYAQF